MKVQELMTRNPSTVTPEMDLTQVAKLMADQDIGAVPVVDSQNSKKVIGMITDRDITIRAVAQGRNPAQVKVQEVMSSSVVTIRQDANLEEVTSLMEQNQVRRVPVVDENGMVCGIVAQADIALQTSDRTTGDTVEKISRPSGSQAGGQSGK